MFLKYYKMFAPFQVSHAMALVFLMLEIDITAEVGKSWISPLTHWSKTRPDVIIKQRNPYCLQKQYFFAFFRCCKENGLAMDIILLLESLLLSNARCDFCFQESENRNTYYQIALNFFTWVLGTRDLEWRG